MPLLEELRGATVRRVDFLRLGFHAIGQDPEVNLGFSTGDREYTFDYPDLNLASLTYAPAKLGTVSGARHNSGIQSEPVNIEIAPFDPALLSRLELGHLHYAQITVFTGFVDDQHNLVDDGIILRFWGYLSSVQTTIQLGGRKLSVTAENRFIEGRRRYGVIAEGSHQKRRYPGDTFADLVPSMAEKEITWGGIRSAGTGGTGINNDGSRTYQSQR